MNDQSRRRAMLVVAVLIILALLLLLWRCGSTPTRPSDAAPEVAGSPQAALPEAARTDQDSGTPMPEEVLTPATLTGPAEVVAGAEFDVAWTGPGNDGDFVTIVPIDAAPSAYANYAVVKPGQTLRLTAPMDASGSDAAKNGHELRYVAARSRTILGRSPIVVVGAGAALIAPAEAVVGSFIEVSWTGPDSSGDYITIAASDWPDDRYGNYTNTSAGSPLRVQALPETGPAELRYVSGQGRVVLGRRAIMLVPARVTLSAPERAVAGATIEVSWSGPDNAGDYITVVPVGTPDPQYGNYTNTSAGQPLRLLTPIMSGEAELRYVMAQGRTILARRPITLVPAEITMNAPEECAAGEPVTISWTGPAHAGDYLTIVPAGTPDGRYASYTNTTAGSPLRVNAPTQAGDAEIRYVSGQGNAVLARRTIRVR